MRLAVVLSSLPLTVGAAMTTWDIVNMCFVYALCFGFALLTWRQIKMINELIAMVQRHQRLVLRLRKIVHRQAKDVAEVYSFAEDLSNHANFWYSQWYHVVVNAWK